MLATRATISSATGLMLLGALSAAIYSAFSRPVFSAYGPMFVTAIGMVFGLLALTPSRWRKARSAGWPHFSGRGWAAVVFLGTVGGVIQFGCSTGRCAGCRRAVS